MKSTKQLLQELQSGKISLEEAENALTAPGHSVPDYDREKRTGFPEVIFCERKTPGQVRDIISALNDHKQNILATRVHPEQWQLVQKEFPQAEYHEDSRIIVLRNSQPPEINGSIAIVSAGTSDLPVAEEAALTAEFYGSRVERFYDIGVAGIHRLFSRMETIKACDVIIVVAGMEGALPSVVGGMVDKPVIAVPTSVGYGASFGGLAALLGMLNSCASGVTVVNIDNGFGAGYSASLILRGYSDR